MMKNSLISYQGKAWLLPKLNELLIATHTGLHASSSTADAGLSHSVPEAVQTAAVKLIQATCLPTSHSKLVCVSVDYPKLFGPLCLFEPVLNSLHKMGVTMSVALVDAQGVITLPVKYQGTEPVPLERDSVVGCLQLVRMIEGTADRDGFPRKTLADEKVATVSYPSR